MHKKVYVAPMMEQFEAQTVQMMASSVFIKGDQQVQQLSHGHRGQWGNLWSEDED